MAIKAQNPNATITFTGHSLGGGLAALMGVFFDCQAVTFDQAPFAAAAEWSLFRPDVAANLRDYLAGKTSLTGELAIARDDLIADLTGYLILREANGGIPRSDLVSTYRVDGEFLGFFPDASKIGTIGEIDHGDYFGPFDLHSQSLLTAFLQSAATAEDGKALNDVTYKLTDLLAMIFDEKLFARSTATSNTTDENFLERLVKHEAGVQDSIQADAMVTRFTSDLWQLAREGGLTLTDQSGIFDQSNNLSKALTAFAMQFYYEDTANATDKDKHLFTDLATAGAGSNGLRFDLADVSKELAAKLNANQPIDLAGQDGSSYVLKGYRYLKDYLGQSGQFTAAERGLIQAQLPSLRDWTVQAGQGGMTATDTENRGAFLLGGKEADTLTGGAKADLLVGNAGADTLDGGEGSDVLLGGQGNDTYRYTSGDAAGLDTVQDSDGQGRIEIDGQAATGGQQFGDEQVYRDGDGRLYARLDNQRLVIAGGLLVENWQAGRLGITLSGPAAEAPLPQTTRDIVGDLAPKDFDADEPGVQGEVDGLLNIITVPEEAAPDRKDPLFDSAGNDHLQGLGGDDIITALRGGDDLIDGGTGSDTMMGGAGDDVMLGGAGNDALLGEGGNDRLYADAQTSVAQAIAAGNGQSGTGQKADWLAGGAGDDLLIGNAGNNLLSGGGGSDLLIGGAGDDYLLGDMDIWPVVAAVPVDFDEINWFVYPHEQQWQVIRNASPHHIEYIFQHRDKPEDPAEGGADVIYGGNGNDVAFAGRGNDIVFGEAGDDELSGEEGNDVLLGGTGDDMLWAYFMKVGAGGTVANGEAWRMVA
ncbi:MAG: lipase family protein [Rhodocyclaceae bacterium]